MATSSIFQNVLVKDKRSVQRLVKALEKSKSAVEKEVSYSRSVEITDDTAMIQKMFGDIKHDGLQDNYV